MTREGIEVGAFTWSRIQRLYDADPAIHWARCDAEGLESPQDGEEVVAHWSDAHTWFAPPVDCHKDVATESRTPAAEIPEGEAESRL
jgi:hypothetical protein